jgi:hypothetical protein
VAVRCTGREITALQFSLDLQRKPEGRIPHENLVVDGRIILKWMFKNGMEWIGFLWFRVWPRGGLF